MTDDVQDYNQFCITSLEQCAPTTTSNLELNGMLSHSFGLSEVTPSIRLNKKGRVHPLSVINRLLENRTHQKLSGQFIIDFSSVNPHFETENNTFQTRIEELSFEIDMSIQLPPVKRITRKVKYKNSKIATPRIIELEGDF